MSMSKTFYNRGVSTPVDNASICLREPFVSSTSIRSQRRLEARTTSRMARERRTMEQGDVIRLSDGEAVRMGCGVVVVMQRDADDGEVKSVVLQLSDLEALMAAL